MGVGRGVGVAEGVGVSVGVLVEVEVGKEVGEEVAAGKEVGVASTGGRGVGAGGTGLDSHPAKAASRPSIAQTVISLAKVLLRCAMLLSAFAPHPFLKGTIFRTLTFQPPGISGS